MFYSLRFRFFIIFFIIFISIILIHRQNNQMMIEKQNSKLNHDLDVFVGAVIINFMDGDMVSTTKMLNLFNFEIISSPPENISILSQYNIDSLKILIFRTDIIQGFRLEYHNNSIVAIKKIDYYDLKSNEINLFLIIISGIVLILFFMFIMILSPILELNIAFKEFWSNKNLKMNLFKTNRKDEIGDLIRAFDSFLSRILSMNKSKELVLRNMGHEIRTPISNIKLLLGLELDKNTLPLLKRYIRQIQHISDNILEFERFNNGSLKIFKNTFQAQSLLLESLNNYINEEDSISVKVNGNAILKGDMRLMSVALSNIIQNALKYSIDGKVYITINDHGIYVKNKGKKLMFNIEHYLQPFYRDEAHFSFQGYGLGLSIVKEILIIHNMSLRYNYNEGNHIFFIDFELSFDS